MAKSKKTEVFVEDTRERCAPCGGVGVKETAEAIVSCESCRGSGREGELK
jgi:DnaJ-class molecular chaperone